VKEELRQRVLASPYGRLFYLFLPQVNYDVHPYGRPGIGSIEDLDAATVEDVRNSTPILSPGQRHPRRLWQFRSGAARSWVDQYFGDIARPNRRDPARLSDRAGAHAAARVHCLCAERAVAGGDDLLSAACFDRSGHSGADGDRRHFVGGESSRLYNSLVYEQQIAAQVFTNLEATQDPGAYGVFAILSEGQTAELWPSRACRANRAHARRAGDASELDEAKNEIVTATLQQRETA
jgi:zinc protease